MKVIDIWFGNLWNLSRPHFELLNWDVNYYFETEDGTLSRTPRYAISIILCSFKVLITVELGR